MKYEIIIQDYLKGREQNVYCETLARAEARVSEMHRWAHENGYGLNDYLLTINKI